MRKNDRNGKIRRCRRQSLRSLKSWFWLLVFVLSISAIPVVGSSGRSLVVRYLSPISESVAQESAGSSTAGGLQKGALELEAPRPVPIEIRNRLTALRAYRDRVRRARRPRPAKVRVPAPVRPDLVPPRMDSGEPQPDWLLPSARPSR
jgi:hypothetical protein